MSRLTLTIFCAALSAGSSQLSAQTEPAPDGAEPRGLKPEFNELKSIVYRRSCLSVASVSWKSDLGREVGSGFFVGAPGKMVTVLPSLGGEFDGEVEVRYGIEAKRSLRAELLASDPYTGLALLGVEHGGEAPPALALGGGGEIEVGDYLYAVGETADVGRACTVGRLAGRDKGIEGKPLATSVLRLNLDVAPGAIGAPVLDREARLVGVLMFDGKGGTAHALPATLVAKLCRDFEKHGKLAPSWIGFGMELGTTTPEILSLHPDSPAGRAGLQAGDVIVSIDGKKVADYQDVIDACYALTPEHPVAFEVLRGLDDVVLEVVPAARVQALQEREPEEKPE